jgi:hypothetical protein
LANDVSFPEFKQINSDEVLSVLVQYVTKTEFEQRFRCVQTIETLLPQINNYATKVMDA